MESSSQVNSSVRKQKIMAHVPDETMRQLIKNSFDILVLLDAEGNQLFVSESCKHILGYHPHELTNISVIDEMIHPDDQEKTRKGLENILLNNNHGGTQYRHRHKKGGWVYLEAFGTNQLEHPNIQAVVLNVRDISARKAAEDKLRESEKRLQELNAAKDMLFSIIGHDLRNPFTIIIGLSDLLMSQIQKGKMTDAQELAQNIYDSSRRINDLLSDLLTWAKAQSGRFNPKMEEIVLKKLAEEVKELFLESAIQKSIQVEVKTDDYIPVLADRQMIHTVLRNLLSNAIKFTPEGGSVCIHTTKDEHDVVVSVKDTGIGMQPENLSRLFKIEHAQSHPGTHGEKGHGLGLLLCKEFISLHHGCIWAESTPGKGSTISFSIPVNIE